MEEMTKDTKAVQDAPASGTEPKKKFSPPKSKKAKKWLKILIAVVVVAAIVAGCVADAAKKANTQLSRQLSGGAGRPAGSDAVRHRHGYPEARRFLQRHHPDLRRQW